MKAGGGVESAAKRNCSIFGSIGGKGERDVSREIVN